MPGTQAGTLYSIGDTGVEVLTMQVQEIMTTVFKAIPASDSIHHAALIMRDEDVGMLPVITNDGILLGTVTDRDIVIRGLAELKHAEALVVEDVMTPGIVCCDADDDIQTLADMMEKNQVRRVIVVSGENKVVGVVSLGDIALKTHDKDLGGEVLEMISRPAG
jgi:CBS domain-containing protein